MCNAQFFAGLYFDLYLDVCLIIYSMYQQGVVLCYIITIHYIGMNNFTHGRLHVVCATISDRFKIGFRLEPQ